MSCSKARTILIVVLLGLMGALFLRFHRGGVLPVTAEQPAPRAEGRSSPEVESMDVPGTDLGQAMDGHVRVVARVMEANAPARETESTLSASWAEALLESLRGRAREQGYHALAWELMEQARVASRDLDPEVLLDELAKLERSLGNVNEGDLVRGACLIVMACAAPDRWFEERFSSIPVDSPEMERAGWLAFALRRRSDKGMEVAPAVFPSWPKLGVYPAVVDCLASAGEIEAARARLRELLPPEFYEGGGRGLPESKQERFTREIVLLTVLGPGAARESAEQEELLTFLTPQTEEQAFVKSAACFVLACAARGSDEIAKRVMRVSSNDTSGTDRIDLLEFMAKQGGRPDLVVEALAGLYKEDGSDDIGVQLSQMIASQLIGELMKSDDPSIRDPAFTIALEGSLDPSRNAHQRLLLLSTLDEVDHDTYLDSLALMLQNDTDAELLGLLSASVRMLGEEDRPFASQLLAQLLGQESLPIETRRFVLGQASMLGGQEAIDLLTLCVEWESDEDLRRYAAELLAGLR